MSEAEMQWYVVASILTILTSSQGILTTLSQSNEGYKYYYAAVPFLVEVFKGVAMPIMNNLLSKWIHVSERSRYLVLVYSGMYLGLVIGLEFSPMLIHNFGWPSVFYSFGSLGTIWFALWLSKFFQQWIHKASSY